LYADFPKFEETKRTIVKMDGAAGRTDAGRILEDETYARQVGRYLVVRKPAKKGGSHSKNITLEIQDVSNGDVIWSRQISGDAPGAFIEEHSGILALASGTAESELKEEDKNAIELPTRFEDLTAKTSNYRIEAVELKSGKVLGTVIINSGKLSFSIRSLSMTANYLAISDSENRVLLYSIRNGQQIGRVFGGPAALSQAGTIAVATQNGKLELYSCDNLHKITDYSFATSIVYSQFNKAGDRLLVFTSDQTVYVIDVPPHEADGIRESARAR